MNFLPLDGQSFFLRCPDHHEVKKYERDNEKEQTVKAGNKSHRVVITQEQRTTQILLQTRSEDISKQHRHRRVILAAQKIS